MQIIVITKDNKITLDAIVYDFNITFKLYIGVQCIEHNSHCNIQ